MLLLLGLALIPVCFAFPSVSDSATNGSPDSEAVLTFAAPVASLAPTSVAGGPDPRQPQYLVQKGQYGVISVPFGTASASLVTDRGCRKVAALRVNTDTYRVQQPDNVTAIVTDPAGLDFQVLDLDTSAWPDNPQGLNLFMPESSANRSILVFCLGWPPAKSSDDSNPPAGSPPPPPPHNGTLSSEPSFLGFRAAPVFFAKTGTQSVAFNITRLVGYSEAQAFAFDVPPRSSLTVVLFNERANLTAALCLFPTVVSASATDPNGSTVPLLSDPSTVQLLPTASSLVFLNSDPTAAARIDLNLSLALITLFTQDDSGEMSQTTVLIIVLSVLGSVALLAACTCLLVFYLRRRNVTRTITYTQTADVYAYPVDMYKDRRQGPFSP